MATAVSNENFVLSEPRDFPSLKLLYYIIKYIQEYSAHSQAPQNTCRQLLDHSTHLYGGIYQRIKDIDAASQCTPGTNMTFRMYADAIEDLEDILTALAFAVKNFSSNSMMDYLHQKEIQFKDMEEVLAIWSKARLTLRKGIEALVNTKTLQSIYSTKIEEWEDALKQDDVSSMQEICDDIVGQLRQMRDINAEDDIDDIRDYFRDMRKSFSVSLEGASEMHRIEIIKTILIICIPINAYKMENTSKKWKAHMKDGSIWRSIKKSVKKLVARVKDIANVPITQFREESDKDFDDIANVFSDVPRPKPDPAGDNPYISLLPLFKQLPRVERPFYSQAKLMTYFCIDIVNEFKTIPGRSSSSNGELHSYIDAALLASQKASIEVPDYNALTESDRLRKSDDFFKLILENLDVFVVKYKLKTMKPSITAAQKKDTSALERIQVLKKGQNVTDQQYFEVVFTETTVRVL